MYELYHETHFANLESILNTFKIMKSSNLYKLTNVVCGQGLLNRTLTEYPLLSITRPDDFDTIAAQVDGSYFRLKKPDEHIIRLDYDVMFVMSGKLLYEYNNVINTEENCGFVIRENIEIGESQFSGEYGMSIINMENIKALETYEFDYTRSEVVVLDDVSLSFVKKIIIKKKFKQFFTPKMEHICSRNSIIVTFI